MSFPEKSAIAVASVLVVVYGAYFALVGSWLAGGPAQEVRYQPLLVVAVVVLALLTALSTALLAVFDTRGALSFDERDRDIARRASVVGGVVLAVAVFAVLVLIMAEVEHVYLAQALLLGWVLAELIRQLSTVALYRRGA